MTLNPYTYSPRSGSLKDGSGRASTQSKMLADSPYTLVSRTDPSPDTLFSNPEELLASARSSCYNMYLSLLISRKGIYITDLFTRASK